MRMPFAALNILWMMIGAWASVRILRGHERSA